MNKDKNKVTVTVTENGEQVFTSTENIVFIVGEHKGVMSADCNLRDLLEFAVKVQQQFMMNIIPQLLKACKPNVTEDMLFNEIVRIAKDDDSETTETKTIIGGVH